VADIVVRAQLFDVLRDLANAGRGRAPDEELWRFYEIVARTQNNTGKMTRNESFLIDDLCDTPAIRRDRHARARIDRYLDGPADETKANQRSQRHGDTARLVNILYGFMEDISPDDVTWLVSSNGRTYAAKVLANRMGNMSKGAALSRQDLVSVAKMFIAMALGEMEF
jgi:hypothetical protein